jgi:hypothetical protein
MKRTRLTTGELVRYNVSVQGREHNAFTHLHHLYGLVFRIDRNMRLQRIVFSMFTTDLSYHSYYKFHYFPEGETSFSLILANNEIIGINVVPPVRPDHTNRA